MILELACIAVYYLACDSLNPNKNRKKETQTKFMEGDIMTEIEKKLKGINITAGGSVNININIQVNEYNECTFNNLTFNESPLHINDFSHSLFQTKTETYLDKALKFSLEETSYKSLTERKLLPTFEMEDQFEKIRTQTLDVLIESMNKKR